MKWYEVTDVRNSLLHLDTKVLVIADITELTKPPGDACQCYEKGTTEAQDQLGASTVTKIVISISFLMHSYPL